MTLYVIFIEVCVTFIEVCVTFVEVHVTFVKVSLCNLILSVNIPRFLKLAQNRIPTLYGLKHTTPDLSSAINCANVCNRKYKVFFGTETVRICIEII